MSFKETWVPVPGYHQYYDVSNHGSVRSLDRNIEISTGEIKRWKGRKLKPKNNGSGYLFVKLSMDGKTTNYYIHRLVAEAFVDKPAEANIVNHIDGNPSNNSYTNLEWVNHCQNVKHGYDNNLNKNKGNGHYLAVGVVDNYLGKEFPTIKEWCEARGIKYSTGRNILCGINKSRVINLETIKLKKNGEENGI